LADYLVALASGSFELLAVENFQSSAPVFDDFLPLLSRAAALLDELNHLLIGPFFFSREWKTVSAGGNHCL